MANPLDRALSLQRRSGGIQAGFAGAVHNRLTGDWMTSSKSADTAVRDGIRTLRNRGRDLGMNNAHAARFLGLVEENVIGPAGIIMQPRVGQQAGTLDKEANWELERGWKEWSEPDQCSADGMLCREEVEQLIARTIPQDGECLIRMLPGFRDSKFGFAVQVLDADQLDEAFSRPATAKENAVRMGVEVNQWGRPVAYHLWSDHPYDYQGTRRDSQRVRVPAGDILHPYLLNRVGQTRGLTWFAPVLLDARMHGQYRQAELTAAVTAAAKMGFFVQHPEFAAGTVEDGKGPLTMEVEPGLIDRLPAGWRFEGWDPQHPTAAFPHFEKAILRSIAAGLRTSYNTLAGDLEGVSFSSLRQGELAARDVWRTLQHWLIRRVHHRLYRRWLLHAITSGAVKLRSRDPSAYLEVGWRARGWQWVDPLKDVLTAEKELGLLLNSHTQICATRGIVFEDLLIEIKREREMMKEHGVELKLTDGKLTVVIDGESEEGGEGGGDRERDRDNEERREALRLSA